ncbi:MAG: hypothetical protein ACKVS8_12865 [Phycisphaerales bacterium]
MSHPGWRVRLCAVSVAGVVAAGASAQTRVYLRGGTDPLPGRVVRMDAGGVTMTLTADGPGSDGAPAPARAPATTRVVSWDRVRGVEADGSRTREIPAAFSELADSLFRARVRLERGDIDLAAPAAERLYARTTTFEGPSGALLAECVLRVRLARGAHASAIEPWLHMVAARGHGGAGSAAEAWVGGTVTLSPVVDEASGLCPALPPIFSPLRGGASLRALVVSPLWVRPDAKSVAGDGQVRAAELAAWYRAAAGHAAGVLAPLPAARDEVADDGLELVRQVVLSRLGSTEERAKARASLERRLALIVASDGSEATTVQPVNPDTTVAAGVRGRWVEAWCRAAIGLSWLRESAHEAGSAGGTGGAATDAEGIAQQRGRAAVQLLHVPARFGAELPQLALIALAEAAAELKALGYTQGAAALEDELLEADGGWAELPAGVPSAPKDRSPPTVEPEKKP